MFFTITGAFACGFMGISEYNLAMRSSKVPEEISFRTLIERKGAGNPNIILTDFLLSDERIGDRGLAGDWKRVWVPIVPADPSVAINSSTGFRALIFSDSVESDEAVRRRLGVAKLQCMVCDGLNSPGLIDSISFKKKYPQTDLAQCIILHAEKTPAGVGTLAMYGAGCIMLLSLTWFVWIAARKMDAVEPTKAPAEEQSKTEKPMDEAAGNLKAHDPSDNERSDLETVAPAEDSEPRPLQMSPLDREVMRQQILRWMRTERFDRYLGDLHMTPGMAIFGFLMCLFVPNRLKPGHILKFIKLHGFKTPLLRRRYRKLAESGEVVLAVTWMANSKLVDGALSEAPALLVMCAEGTPEAEAHTQKIYFKMADRNEGSSASQDEKVISEMLSDEQYVRFRVRPLPVSFAENRPVYLVDTHLHQDAIAGGKILHVPFIVCLFHPKMIPCILPIPTEVLRESHG